MLKSRSLRFWVGLGMIVAVAPLALSAGLGYVLLHRGVIAPIHDVALRQREQIGPVQDLRLLIWDAVIPIDEFVEDADAAHAQAYRDLRARIEKGFVTLIEALGHSAATQTLVERARASWTSADELANGLISVSGPQEAEAMASLQRFHGEIRTASDRLSAVSMQLVDEVAKDHDLAMRAYERSLWIAGIAGAMSLLAIVAGVTLIGQIMIASVKRLVDGAERFAAGDRDHRIEVAVPPELRRVANQFNRMIVRIHDSEEALAELARQDTLTGLPNRRAFDDAFADSWARFRRSDAPSCLLALDIDHFKRINDTYGHAAGDEALRLLATVMRQSLRSDDQAFRTGGEEFAILLPNTRLAEACEHAERLREVVGAASFPFDGHEIDLTVSIGVAETTPDLDAAGMIEAADRALYAAKHGGRNRVVAAGKGRDRHGDDAA